MKKNVLKNFMIEFFDFDALVECGFFKKEWEENYQRQAEQVCYFFGYDSIYEYGAKGFSGHVTFAKNERPLFVDEKGKLKTEPFITTIKGIYK